MDFKITIIVPVFNEAGNLLRLEQELRYFIRDAPVTAMVLFINDGSTDQSQSIIESICDRNPEFNYIQFSKNAGLSAALKAGFEHTKTELIGYIDADLQTSPEDFNLLLEHIENYDLVTGVRQHRKDSALKKTSSIVANTVRRLFTKDGMDDTGCPLKIMKTEYAKGIPMF
ncbi:MAG: glycosyltransferase involved in cell wall biosynthesis, partial [Psychroserpens sp.]